MSWIAPEYFEEIKSAVTKELGTAAERVATLREKQSKATAKKLAEQKKLLSYLLAGTIDDAAYKSRMAELQSEINVIENEAGSLSVEFDDIEATLQFARLALIEPRTLWRKLNDDQRLPMLHIWFPDGIMLSDLNGDRTTVKQKAPATYEKSTGACKVWLPQLGSNQRHMD